MLDSSQAGGIARDVAVQQQQQTHTPNTLDLPDFFDDDTDIDDEEELTPKRRWYRRPRWIALIAGLLIVALIIGFIAAARGRSPAVTYTTGQVTQGDLTTTVSATGPIQSATYNVNFSGSGKISEIDVSVGQQVSQGQVLAKLDPTSLQDAVTSAQDAVNSAQTSLNNAFTSQSRTNASNSAQLNAAYQTEQDTLNGTSGSGCKGPNPTGGSQAACDQAAEDAYAQAQAQAASSNAQAAAQVNSAQAQLNSARDNLATAQHNLGDATLTAPHSGVVGAINGSVGGTPGSGGSSGSSGSSSGSGGSGGTFIEIVDLSSLQVVADVNEADIAKIAVGQTANFTVSAYSTQRFQGSVSAISPLGQSSSNVVTYPVTITVDTTNLQGATLLPQMTANVTITTAQRVNVLLVPATAITFARSGVSNGLITRSQLVTAIQQAAQLLSSAQSSDPTAAKDNLTPSFVLERSNGKWVVKPVVLGLSNGSNYEVVAGLSQGETVVTGQSGGTTTTSNSTTPRSGAGGGFGGGGFGGGGRGGAGGGGGDVPGGAA